MHKNISLSTMTSAVLAALAMPIHIGAPHHMGRTRYPTGWRNVGSSRYMPHQGAREKARRVRQMADASWRALS